MYFFEKLWYPRKFIYLVCSFEKKLATHCSGLNSVSKKIMFTQNLRMNLIWMYVVFAEVIS